MCTEGVDFMSGKLRGILLVLISAAGFATLAIFIKFAFADGLNPETILTYRFGIAAVILWASLFLLGISPRVSGVLLVRLLLLGSAGYSVMSFLFAASLKYLSASLSAILLYTYPALVLLLSVALGNDSFSVRKIFALAICTCGLLLVLGITRIAVHPAGILLGLGAAIVYSLYIVASHRFIHQVQPLVAATYVCSAAAVTFFFYASARNALLWPIPPSGWFSLLGMAVPGTVVGILFFFHGLYHIGPSQAAIVSTAEPLITVLLSVTLLHDSITLLQLLGGVMVLGGILLLQLSQPRTKGST